MPLFIDDKDTFEVVVRYKEQGRKILFYEDSEELPSDVKTEKFTFKYPNWSEQQAMMAGALTIDQNGVAAADPYKYMDAKIKTMLRGWTLTKDNEPLQVTYDNIEKLDGSLVSYLTSKIDLLLGTDETTTE
jgi:hypothetical protein